MRLRLIAFLPPAALVTFLLLVSASSFVSAVEQSLIAESAAVLVPIRVQSYESECDVLTRELRTLSHAVTSCDAEPSCLGSPLLCPVTMDANAEREYQRLRSALSERCEVPRGLMGGSGGPVAEASGCGVHGAWFEAGAASATQPRQFIF